jgi:hypothetical protein
MIHADGGNGDDRTLCGDAFEGIPGDTERPVVAKTGEIVTCEACKQIIDYCKTFKRHRQP